MNKKKEWGCHGRKWGRGWGGCPYRKNEQEKSEEKQEEKPVMKEEKPVTKEEMKEECAMKEVSQEEIIQRANTLCQVFGYDFPKCLKRAQEYSELSAEELLSFCLEDRSFIE